MSKEKLHLVIFIMAIVTVGLIPPAAASISIASGETTTFTANESWTIDGSLTIGANGALDASADGVSISLDGDWSNEGTFTAGVSTVTLTGSGVSAIDGATTFYNFNCTTAGKQLTFESSKEQTIANKLTLLGTSANKLVLRSSTPGTRWTLKSTKGVQSVNYLDISDASAVTNLVKCYNSTDSGNNDNWIFVTLSITSPETGKTVGLEPTVTGKGGPGDIVTIKDKDGNGVATVTADANENFAVQISTPLATGTNSLTAYLDTLVSNTVDLTVAENPTTEQVPIINSIVPGEKQRGDTPVITGKGKPGSTAYLLAKDEEGNLLKSAYLPTTVQSLAVIATTTVDATGNFSFNTADYSGALAKGTNSLMVMVEGVVSNLWEITLVDPFGVVFDSVSDRPLSGAVVTVYKSDGSLARPGVDLDAADVNPQTTGADGTYNFICVDGNYYFTVTASNYKYPADRLGLSTGRVIATGSKGETFNVASKVIQLDLPLDPNGDLSCYPNPFNPYKENITIQYTLENESEVKIAIYDLLGNLVKTWEIPGGSQYARTGLNQLTWDGRNGVGDVVANGGYILLLHANDTKQKFKILVLE